MSRKRPSYFLYILESPSGDDLFDQRTEGNVLLEALRLSRMSNQTQYPVIYRLVVNEKSFDRAMLIDLPNKLNELKNTIPILHLSMHGNKDGLQLTDGTEVDWNELSKLLSDINKIFAKNKLIICLSACHGLYGSFMQFVDRRKRPFKAIVGPMNQPRWDDAAVAYVTFYHLIMDKGRSVKTAVDAMRSASGNYKFDYFTPKTLLSWGKGRSKKQKNKKIENSPR